MAHITMNYELAHAIAHDHADRRMRSEGRKKWNRDDYNLACRLVAALLEGEWADTAGGTQRLSASS